VAILAGLIIRQDGWETFDWFRSITLVPGSESGAQFLPVSWTLSFELMFYFVFALTMALPRAASLAFLCAWGLFTLSPVGDTTLWTSPFVAEFAPGAGLAAWIARFGPPQALQAFALAVVACVLGVTLHEEGDTLTRVIFFGPFGAALIASVVALEMRGLYFEDGSISALTNRRRSSP
jgi:peptidoglycan/LPS O-acetylase OafA/YrhL